MSGRNRDPDPDMSIEMSRRFADRDLSRSDAKGEAQSEGVQVRERNGIWEVREGGVFRGDYHQREHALAAAESLKLSR